jgi:hypothetical protein
VPALEGNDVVQVTGTVRDVDRDTFETEFGIPWDDDFGGFGTRHAIVATSVDVIGQIDEGAVD